MENKKECIQVKKKKVYVINFEKVYLTLRFLPALYSYLGLVYKIFYVRQGNIERWGIRHVSFIIIM